MKKEEKIKFELTRQNLLYRYWNDAEKIELGTLSFLFGAILVPTIINFSFDFKDWVTYLFLVEIIAIIYLSRRTLNNYQKEQKNVREKVENLKI